MFLAQLGAVIGRPEFMQSAARVLTVAPALVAAWAERPGHLVAIGGGFDGMDGVAYALRRLSVLLDSADLERTAELAAKLAANVDDGAGARAESHCDPVDPDPELVDDSWCHGLAGQAAAGALDATQLTAWLTRLGSAPILEDLTVCHGEFGLLEALMLLASDNDLARRTLRRRAARLPEAIARGAVLSSAPGAIPTPGFLHGLAGVGYGLLRVAFPQSVPSVLTLQSGP